MARRILVVAVAVFALLALSLVALAAVFDVNRFKPQIVRAVAERTGRTLTIDGELSLSFFPRLAVSLPPTALSGAGGRGEFASLRSASLSVALLPLLRGAVVADALRIHGLEARVVRGPDGRSSIDDLLGKTAVAPASHGETGSEATVTAPPGSARARGTDGAIPFAFAIAGVELTDAAIAFEDRRSGGTLSASGLSLRTGALASRTATPVTLAARVASTRPRFEGSLKLDGRLAGDLPAGRAEARELVLTLNGTLDGRALETRLTSPALATRFAGPTVSAERLAIDVSLVDGQTRAVLALSTPLQADFDAGTIALPAVAGTAEVSPPAGANRSSPGSPSSSLSLATQASVTIDLRRETANVRAQTKLDGASLKSQLTVQGFGRPSFRLELDADRLDLDRLMPLAAVLGGTKTPSAQKAPAAGIRAMAADSADRPTQPPSTSRPADKAGPRPQAPAGPTAASSDLAVDLSALAALRLAAEVRIGALVVHGLHASQVTASIRADDGRAVLAPINASLYGGRVSARAGAAAGGNRVSLAGNVTDVQIGPLLRDTTGRDALEGRGRFEVDFSTSGASVAAMKRGLQGSVSLALHDGAVKGINLGEILRRAEAAIAGGKAQRQAADTTQKTDFSELSASATIRDGVATSDDLDLKSPLLRVGGAGRADLAAQTLDYTARVSVVGTSKGQGGRELEQLRGVTIPVRLSGSFSAPAYEVDWAGVAREALRSRLADTLKQRLAPRPDAAPGKPVEPRDALKDKLRERLEGLLRR